MPDAEAKTNERTGGGTKPVAADDLRRRRSILVSALVLALCIVGIVAVLAARDKDPLAGSKSPVVAPATPIARITLRPTGNAPRNARGIAEVVKREGAYELRLIAENLKKTTDDSEYRVYFDSGAAERTVGRAWTDARGTLIGEGHIDADDLKKFKFLRVALETPKGESDVLRGRLPR